MAYERNTAGQQIVFAAINKTTGDVVSGDALNITGVFSTDGNAAALMGNSATEIDAGGMPGFYKMPLRSVETDGSVCLYRLFSSTADVVIDPVVIYPVVYSDYKATAPTVQEIVDGVWDEPLDQHYIPSTMGITMTQIGVIFTICQSIDSDTTQIIATGGPGPWTTGAGGTAPTVAEIVDGVWDESLSNHQLPGTTGINQNLINAITVELQQVDIKVDSIITTGGPGPWTTGSGTTPPTVAEIVDGVWDEPIGDHNVTNTFGNAYITAGGGLVEADIKRINQDQPSVDSLKRIFRTYDIDTDVSNASADTITFNDASISSIDDFYNGMVVLIHGGTGVGQARQIVAYDGSTKKATITPPWGQQPVAGSSDATIIDGNHLPGDVWDSIANDHTGGNTFGALLNRLAKSYGGVEGTVDGSSTTSTINSTDLGPYASGAFDHQLCVITSGTLVGEARPILSQPGASLQFEELWTSAPEIGSEFVILPQHVHPVSEINQAVLDRGGPGPWTTGGGGGGSAGAGGFTLTANLVSDTLEAELVQ